MKKINQQHQERNDGRLKGKRQKKKVNK